MRGWTQGSILIDPLHPIPFTYQRLDYLKSNYCWYIGSNHDNPWPMGRITPPYHYYKASLVPLIMPQEFQIGGKFWSCHGKNRFHDYQIAS